MHVREIRDLSQVDLVEALEEAHKEFFALRFRAVTRQLGDVSQVRKARRNVARLKTIIGERALVRNRE